MTASSIDERIKLSNGTGIPVLGFGTFRMEPGARTRTAVSEALKAGYRHIDTARMYRNEEDVGEAVRGSGIPREEVFVTTKLQNSDQGRRKAVKAFLDSDRDIGLGHIDLYLLHWPVTGLRKESWRSLEELYKEGLCRAIGVSNFTVRHLEDLIDGSDIVPMVNQVELSPFLDQGEILTYCAEKGIIVEAYSPLTRGTMFGDPRLIEMSDAHNKTPAQVLIRYAVQLGTVPLPSSSEPSRIRENADVFDFSLNDAEMKAMRLWDMRYRVSWDPSNVP